MADLKEMASKLNVSLETTGTKDNSPSEENKNVGHKRRAWLNNNEDGVHSTTRSIHEINPSEVTLWIHKDRPENELGDLESFARELKAVGQIQPGIVRTSNDIKFKYELIIGERRWRACKLAGLQFQVEIKNYSDNEAALAQAAENEERKQLSDYAKGMSYARLIEMGILKQTDLTSKLGISRQQVSRLLSFKDIPITLRDAIGDLTLVTARTAEEIRLLCNKNSENISTLISIAGKIASGIGAVTLQKEVKRALENEGSSINTEKVPSINGRHLFTWRQDGNGNRSISFPKDIRLMIDYKKLEKALVEVIQQQLEEIKNVR